MTYRRFVITMIALAALLVVLALACLVFGSVDIPAGKIMDILAGKGSGKTAWDIIILQSRLPMIATAALAGAALSISGLLLQTTFNNPLAGPSILGVSSGAGLGGGSADAAYMLKADYSWKCMLLVAVLYLARSQFFIYYFYKIWPCMSYVVLY